MKRGRRRCWLQFSLLTLFVLVAAVAGALMALRAYTDPYRRQRQTIMLIGELGGRCQTGAAANWLRWLYGDGLQDIILVDVANCDDPEAYLDELIRLPSVRTLVVGGPRFTDEHLARFSDLNTL